MFLIGIHSFLLYFITREEDEQKELEYPAQLSECIKTRMMSSLSLIFYAFFFIGIFFVLYSSNNETNTDIKELIKNLFGMLKERKFFELISTIAYYIGPYILKFILFVVIFLLGILSFNNFLGGSFFKLIFGVTTLFGNDEMGINTGCIAKEKEEEEDNDPATKSTTESTTKSTTSPN